MHGSKPNRLKMSGGSYDLTIPRTTTKTNLKQNALERAIQKFGNNPQIASEFKEQFALLCNAKAFTPEWDIADGMIISLIKLNFSQLEIRAVLEVGGYRVSRLQQIAHSGTLDGLHTRRLRPPPAHAFTLEQKQDIKDEYKFWELEDGYPCVHRRPIMFFCTEGITWLALWKRYKDRMNENNKKHCSYSRWLQYTHYYYPGLRMARPREDECDACVRLGTLLKDDALTPARRKALEEEKAAHLQAAVDQRRFMSKCVHELVKKLAPDQRFPGADNLLPDYIDEPLPDEEDEEAEEEEEEGGEESIVLVQAEDFGGGLALPHYGYCRPSADYYASNLIVQNFVIANINDNENHILIYDERAQDKGADALCSLRLYYHLGQRDRYKRSAKKPKFSVSILDNCVGQNKSNLVMKFNALLSLLFYEKVVLLYLISGHSHMIADRVVSMLKKSIYNRNIYHPSDIAKQANTYKTVKAEFLDHKSPKRPFFVGWEVILNKYFNNMPPQFTFNYFFEFDRGDLTMRHLSTTPDTEARSVKMLKGDPLLVRNAILFELFGHKNVSELSVRSLDTIKLARHPGCDLTDKKIASLSEKYFSIPAAYLPYFPTVPDVCDVRVSDAVVETVVTPPPKKPRAEPIAPGVRKVGRPSKKTAVVAPKQKSILACFARVETI